MGQEVGPVRIEHDEVNAADYNENGTLDANAARAKTANPLKTPKTANQVETAKTPKTAKTS